VTSVEPYCYDFEDHSPETLNALNYCFMVLEACGMAFSVDGCMADSSDFPDGREYRQPIGNLKDALPAWSRPLRLLENPAHTESPGSVHNQDPDACYTDVVSTLSQLIVGPGEVLAKLLSEYRYIGPIRDVPPRNYSPPRRRPADRWANGLAAWDWLAESDDDGVAAVADWMAEEDKLNTGYSIRFIRYLELDRATEEFVKQLAKNTYLEPDDDARSEVIQEKLDELRSAHRLALIDVRSGLEVQPYDVGVGIAQLVPIVVASVDDTHCLTGMEQPELHLHPAVQVRLGDLFIDRIKNGLGSLLLETHSEHLLLRLLRRVRETHDGELSPDGFPLRPDQISIVFFDKADGVTHARPLLVNERGDFDGWWPEGFFDERARELY
jgi:hypothetical protein